MSVDNRDISPNGNVSNKLKLAMAFHIWRVLDIDEYRQSLDYIDKNKWVLFTLVMASYQKMLSQHKKTPQEIVSEIAWATGYIIPPNFDYRLCGYDPSISRHALKDAYVITPHILKNSIDIDIAHDDAENGSVADILKQLPFSCWLNLKDTVRKYNKTWDEDIRTNLYQWMGLGYEYVLDFYSFINVCAYHRIAPSPLQSVWNSYMKSAVQKPLIYIAKDFPEYRSFWQYWYNQLYQYAYEMFDLADSAFAWTSQQSDQRKQYLVHSGLWTDFNDTKTTLSVNKNAISIDTRNFAEKWLGKSLNPPEHPLEFHGFFTSLNRNDQSHSSAVHPKTDNISMDEIKELISMTSLNEQPVQQLPERLADVQQSDDTAPPSDTAPPPETISHKVKRILSNFFNRKQPSPPPPPTPEPSPDVQVKNQYLDTLEQNADNPVFHNEIEITKNHIEQVQSRLYHINDILSQHFTPNEMSYKRFAHIIENAATRFYANIKTMLKRINLFDTKDYLKISDPHSTISPAARTERLKIYKEHILYVKKLVDANENIISKLDKLLLELTKLDDFSENSLNNNPAVNELNELIEQTKYYNN